jgi:hypothetical protein
MAFLKKDITNAICHRRVSVAIAWSKVSCGVGRCCAKKHYFFIINYKSHKEEEEVKK